MSKIYSSRYTGQEIEGLLNKTSQSATQKELIVLETDVDNKIAALETDVDNKIAALETDVDNKIASVKSGTQVYKLELKAFYGDNENPNALQRLYLTLYTLNKVDFIKRPTATTPSSKWSIDFVNNLLSLHIVGSGLCKETYLNGTDEVLVETFRFISVVQNLEYEDPLCLQMLEFRQYSKSNSANKTINELLYSPYCVDYTYSEV